MKLFIFFLLFSICSCSEPDFKKFYELGDLRIIGIEADIPEVDGNSTSDIDVTLTPYISDFTAAGRTFTVTVISCLDPGFTRGAEPQCQTSTIETYPNGNTFNTSSLSTSNYTGAMDPITITIANPSNLISSFSNQQKFNGVNYLVAFSLTSGSTSLTAVKAIPISTRPTLNSNPEIENILLDSGVLTTSPLVKGSLSMTYTTNGGEEVYNEMLSDGSLIQQTESFLITWFYTKGKVVPGRIIDGQTSKFNPDSSAATTLVGVLRDRRGGTDIKILNP